MFKELTNPYFIILKILYHFLLTGFAVNLFKFRIVKLKIKNFDQLSIDFDNFKMLQAKPKKIILNYNIKYYIKKKKHYNLIVLTLISDIINI